MRNQSMVLAVALGLAASACRADERASAQVRPPGEEKRPSTKALEKGAELLQDLTPVRQFDHYLDGFHVMRDAPEHHMEAHHYCAGMNEELTQCVIFDGTGAEANLIGIEYILSERLFEELPEEEKSYWHPHNYEILSGALVMPGVPAPAEKEALERKMNSYGKTWHIWDTGHLGHPAANPLPLGEPLLAWSYNRDGEMPEQLARARDQRLSISTEEKRRERRDLADRARPQRGVDDMRPAFPEAGGAPPGVMGK
jgi:hypothetical protein